MQPVSCTGHAGQRLGRHTLVAAVTVGLVFVAAAASYYLVERPCLRVKTFFSRA